MGNTNCRKFLFVTISRIFTDDLNRDDKNLFFPPKMLAALVACVLLRTDLFCILWSFARLFCFVALQLVFFFFGFLMLVLVKSWCWFMFGAVAKLRGNEHCIDCGCVVCLCVFSLFFHVCLFRCCAHLSLYHCSSISYFIRCSPCVR